MNSNLSVTDDLWQSTLRLFSGTRFPFSVPGFPARARAVARVRRMGLGGRCMLGLACRPSLSKVIQGNCSLCEVYIRLRSVGMKSGLPHERIGLPSTIH